MSSHYLEASEDALRMVDVVYEALEGSEDLQEYHRIHGTPSLLILTQLHPTIAKESARLLAPEIEGKRVIEIGAGVGFLAMEMAEIADSVVAIESDPAWSWVFTHHLYRHKPPNLTWIFGAAESVADQIHGDIAVIFTRSGVNEMIEVAAKMAPRVICPLQGLDEKALTPRPKGDPSP